MPPFPPPSADPIDAGVSLFVRFPELAGRLPWRPLGVYPTPVQPIADRPGLWIKREDLSSPAYGGNKVRTIEGHIGYVLARGVEEIWSTGAYGSNHALCTAIHAGRVGLRAGAVLFPQPPTSTAQTNLRAMIGVGASLRALMTPVTLPLHMLQLARRAYVMTPGGAVPRGAFGHVSAAFELAAQVADGSCPSPQTIVLPVGSTCTSAGLLVGLQIAARNGWWPAPAPRVMSVAIGPWPFTSKAAILWLAKRTLRSLEGLLGRSLNVQDADLAAGLQVERRFIGRGYGHPTAWGAAAKSTMTTWGGPPLDAVYSAKAGAAALELSGETLFWSTKSSAPLPRAGDEGQAPWLMRRWLARPPALPPPSR